MKNLFILFVFIFSIVLISTTSSDSFEKVSDKVEINNTLNDEFDEGWEIGFCEGWKDVKGQYAFCPHTPFAPFPKIGEDGYRHGYNRGFKYGMCKAREYENCKK